MAKTLKTAIGSYGHTAALKDGSVKPPAGYEFDFVEISPIINAFRRMVRQLEFDVCEMAITTYLAAKAYNKPFTAIPVFPVRAFHHGATVYNTKSGIQSPKDLEGKKVGVRAYTVTTGVWARGILASQYGVDLDKVNWVIADEEHVSEFQLPSNVEFRAGANLGQLVASGDLDAAIGVGAVDSPDVKPLIANGNQVAGEWYKSTGIYPINHMIVVKDELLQADPNLAEGLYQAFTQAKEKFLEKLNSGAELSAEDQAIAQRRNLVGQDPLPYGVEPNRKALEAIVEMGVNQHILKSKVRPEDLFAKTSGS